MILFLILTLSNSLKCFNRFGLLYVAHHKIDTFVVNEVKKAGLDLCKAI